MRKFTESIRYGRIRLLKRADSGFWYAKYRLPDSPRRVEKALHTSIRKDAEKIADYLNARIVNKTLGITDGSVPIGVLFEKYFGAQVGHISAESVKGLHRHGIIWRNGWRSIILSSSSLNI